MVWPEGMLPLPRNTDPELSNQVSEKFPWGGMATGRRRRKLSFKTVVKISESATASPASRAVPLAPEIGPLVRVGGDQSSGHGQDRRSRNPVFVAMRTYRETPDLFLIAGQIGNQLLPTNRTFRTRGWLGCVFGNRRAIRLGRRLSSHPGWQGERPNQQESSDRFDFHRLLTTPRGPAPRVAARTSRYD